ncbi:MAG: Si-specific NAD(P)(+) transhydrogenase [Actinomycetota bacterium]|nr:Si-specific NAD(P)(+) transhydrogenase [Actinomycetota bacterium]
MSYDYDLLVIGSGPSGQKAAIQAAKVDRTVALVERRNMVGGVCVNTGTIPSKTLRESIVYLTGMNQRALYGRSYRPTDELTMDDLLGRAHRVVGAEIDVIRDQLRRNQVELLTGSARFADPHNLIVRDERGGEQQISGDKIVIAVGTCPARPESVAFDERTILDSDGILVLDQIPGSMVVVGAGVVGIEYASMFAALGTKVTVVERRARLLDFCDIEITEALQYHLRDLGVTFRFNETVTGVDSHKDGALTYLKSGKKIASRAVMYSAGRQGATESLGLEKAGLEADGRGRISVESTFQTSEDNIYAVGDVIGFPSLAASSAEQGRLAARHAFGLEVSSIAKLLPVGIYTIPEVSFVGKTEEELTEHAIPYEVGISRYRELARGQIVGDSYGMLKLLVSPDDHKLLGVHVFGTSATEVVHIGQAVMGTGGTIDFLMESVFNYPTLAESYKVAALDAMNKIQAIDQLVG